MKCNQSRPGFELMSLCPVPTRITITPRAPLTDHNNAVVWIVSTRSLISKSSSTCTKHLMTVQSAPITTGITATFVFHTFFRFSSKVYVLLFSFRFLSVLPCGLLERKVPYLASSLFLLLIITWYGRLDEIRWSVYISKSQRSFGVSSLRAGSGLYI